MRVTLLIILCFAYLLKFSSSTSDVDINSPINNDVTEQDPLILTPLIEEGKIDEARRQALVHHEEMQNVESYAGYLTVNKKYNSNMFFWYFPAQKNPRDAPLLLYLSGGPGASSLISVFYGGPFIVTQNFTLKTREHSWHTHHHVLYLESPIGTGYSFTDDDAVFVTNQTEYTRDLLPVLLQFFQLFPELRKNDFYVAGESYGGKFACSTSWAIKQHNDAGKTKINLVGILLLNGALDPLYQMSVTDYWYATGLIDSHGSDQVKKLEIEVHQLMKQRKYEEAAMVKDRIVLKMFTTEPTLFENLTGFSGLYYYNVLQAQTPADFVWTIEFTGSASLRKALHVGNVSYASKVDKVRSLFKSDSMQSMVPVLADLLQHYRVLVLSGQMDTVVPYPRTQDMLWNLNWPGVSEYRNAKRKKWKVNGNLIGYVKSAGNLTEVMVKKAGHRLTVDQPLWIWNILNRFTGGVVASAAYRISKIGPEEVFLGFFFYIFLYF